jgi:hypothetical protein
MACRVILKQRHNRAPEYYRDAHATVTLPYDAEIAHDKQNSSASLLSKHLLQGSLCLNSEET